MKNSGVAIRRLTQLLDILMKFRDIFGFLMFRKLSTSIESSNKPDSFPVTPAMLSDDELTYIKNIRSQFYRCVESLDAFTCERDTDVVRRIHPILATNLDATLQRGTYANFFKCAKLVIIEVGNLPTLQSGPSFGTDFVSFERWKKTVNNESSNFSKNLSAWQPFIDKVCQISEVLSNPVASLKTGKLSSNMALLAEVAIKDVGWDSPDCLAHMRTSALFTVKQLRALVETVVPNAFAKNQ